MKYKLLTEEQILISIDRLTRFKETKQKYLRVYSDILVSNLIEPKLKKTEIEKLDYSIITKYVSEIFNASLKSTTYNNIINNIIKDYENNLFNNDEEVQKLLNNNINYLGVYDLITEKAPINLQWLKELINLTNKSPSINIIEELRLRRISKFLKHPIEKVILVEGITEEILLPAFSKFLGYDFYAEGIQIIPAGGKNQVVKMYYQLSEYLKLPIFILLDKDAEENIKQITPRLRKNDKIHLVSCGEFEDLLPKSLIVKTVNSHFENFISISEEDLLSETPTAKVLEEIFKTKGLHEFKKAEFAKLVREKISTKDDISLEIEEIIKELKL